MANSSMILRVEFELAQTVARLIGGEPAVAIAAAEVDSLVGVRRHGTSDQ